MHISRILYHLPFFFLAPAVFPEIHRKLPCEPGEKMGRTGVGVFNEARHAGIQCQNLLGSGLLKHAFFAICA
jgi:hypothetical protein